MAAGKLIQFRLTEEEVQLLNAYIGNDTQSESDSLKAKKALLDLITGSNQNSNQSNQSSNQGALALDEKLADIEANVYERLSKQVSQQISQQINELAEIRLGE